MFKTLVTEVDGRLVVGVVPVIDNSVRSFETVYCSAGRRGLQVELAPDALVHATRATVAAIATG